ncbi:MAG: energy-coupling factor transporter ATPase [Clostridia bacterium]|nr:energy-coupling factor transporter ATPase [Clostridia bacterium]
MIQIKQLCFQYQNEETEEIVPVLKGIDLEIKRGEFLAVLGHNGSGKSTLAKHLNAILTPTSGQVLVEGIDTADESRLYDIRQRVGMVFQNPDNQMVANIVEEDVAFAPENLGVPREEIRRRVDDALAAVNMTRFIKHAPHMLSGGQKQRIAIAGVLAMQPDVLVLDEPTAMLDPSGRKGILEAVKKLNKERGMTVVLITHYMDEAVQADRVVVIDHGTIQMEGLPKEVFPRVQELKALGLDTPQATELVYLLNRAGANLNPEVLDAEACIEELLRKIGEFHD